ncbi:MAG: helix-turn-helix transcriptional regulator [Clostridiales bacterium]|nr:helix-turn-helix transcriptional regulator [Clostridiales bacterium]
MDKFFLGNAWELLEEVSNDEDKKEYGLYDIFYYISTKIFDYRLEKGLSQKQLAEILGITQAMVSKLESGEYNPTVEQLWKVSRKLGWSMKVLLEDSESKATHLWDNVEIQELSEGSKLFTELGLIGA